MAQATRCPMCAEDIGLDATVCPFCGARLTEDLEGYCTTCHDVVAADRGGACRRCGGPLADLHAPSATAAASPVGPPTAADPVRAVAPTTPLPASSAAAEPQPAPVPLPTTPEIPSWWTGRPARPERSLGDRLRIAFVVVMGSLLVLAVGLGALFLATGGIEMLKPVAPVTFDTIGQYPDERRVTLEGRLRLPGSLRCDDNCGVYLVDPASSDREIPLFIDVAEYSATAAPNQMERLSYLYETGDFRVHIDGGGWVGDGALVRVTGHVCRTEVQHDVCVHAQQIEAVGE